MENARVIPVTHDVICCEHQCKTWCATTQVLRTVLLPGFTIDKSTCGELFNGALIDRNEAVCRLVLAQERAHGAWDSQQPF